MKKFSKITKQKVNEAPEIKSELSDDDIKKLKLETLLNKYLSLKIDGPTDRYMNASSVRITGKEMLIEALLDMMDNLNNDKTTKILESLKSEIRNWEAIDNKIKSLNENKILLENKTKFNKILNKYKDEESLILFFENKKDNLTDKTKKDYIKLINESNLSNNTKERLINLF